MKKLFGKKKTQKDKNSQMQPDFYFENGFIVFTETFLRKRGYCCKSGCRHCPYGFNKESEVNEKSSK